MKNFFENQNFANPYVTSKAQKKHNFSQDVPQHKRVPLDEGSATNGMDGAVPIVETRPVSDLSDSNSSMINSNIIDNIKKEEI